MIIRSAAASVSATPLWITIVQSSRLKARTILLLLVEAMLLFGGSHPALQLELPTSKK